MDVWEEIGRNKTPEQKAREELENTRHAWRVGIFIAVIVALFFGFGIYPQWPKRLFESTIWSLTPYAKLHFEKVNNVRPKLKIVPAQGWIYNINTSSAVAYDNKSIYIYNSLSLNELKYKIPVAGDIESVETFTQSWWSVLDLLGKAKSKHYSSTGLFIACKYKTTNTSRLDTYFIAEINEFQAIKLSSIDFNGCEFIAFYSDGSYMAADKIEFTIKHFSSDGNALEKIDIGKQFIFGHDYYRDYCNVYIFDGKTYYNIRSNVEKKMTLEAKKEIKESSGLINSHFVKNNSEQFNHCDDIILVNNGNYFVIYYSGYSYADYYHMFLNNNGQLISYNIAEISGKKYLFDCRQKNISQIQFKHLSTNKLFWDPKTNLEPDTVDTIVAGMYINLGLNESENNTPIIMFDYRDMFLECKTSGIDEPITDAYISYEGKNMCIYFMNDKSIYQCKLSRKEFDNLKLREIDLKPEPIKTSK